MSKSIAAGSALLCATLAWFIFGFMLSVGDNAPLRPETVGTVAAVMFICGTGLLVISPFIGLFGWARRRSAA